MGRFADNAEGDEGGADCVRDGRVTTHLEEPVAGLEECIAHDVHFRVSIVFR